MNFKDYVDYLKDNPSGYWFKRKLYGYGWTPSKWQGWLISLIFAVLLFLLSLTINDASTIQESMFTYILPALILIFILIYIAHKKGEKLAWQWGPNNKKRQQ